MKNEKELKTKIEILEKRLLKQTYELDSLHQENKILRITEEAFNQAIEKKDAEINKLTVDLTNSRYLNRKILKWMESARVKFAEEVERYTKELINLGEIKLGKKHGEKCNRHRYNCVNKKNCQLLEHRCEGVLEETGSSKSIYLSCDKCHFSELLYSESNKNKSKRLTVEEKEELKEYIKQTIKNCIEFIGLDLEYELKFEIGDFCIDKLSIMFPKSGSGYNVWKIYKNNDSLEKASLIHEISFALKMGITNSRKKTLK